MLRDEPYMTEVIAATKHFIRDHLAGRWIGDLLMVVQVERHGAASLPVQRIKNDQAVLSCRDGICNTRHTIANDEIG